LQNTRFRSGYCQVRILIVCFKEKIPIVIPFFLDSLIEKCSQLGNNYNLAKFSLLALSTFQGLHTFISSSDCNLSKEGYS